MPQKKKMWDFHPYACLLRRQSHEGRCVLPAQRRLRTWWRETDARRGGPARPYSRRRPRDTIKPVPSGLDPAAGRRSGPPVDRARPDVDALRPPATASVLRGSRHPQPRRLVGSAGRRSGGRARLLHCSSLVAALPGAPAPPAAAAARPASARSPAGAEGRTGTAHRLGIGAHGFPGPLLAPAACSALASASYVPLWWRRAARDRVAEFARWKWNEPGGL